MRAAAKHRAPTPHRPAGSRPNLRTLAACDLALFNFSGSELDAGTVGEFLFAKFADIPAVLLRSDPRSGGAGNGGPANLMCSFYPRTEQVLLDCLSLYRKFAKQRRLRLVDTHLLAGSWLNRSSRLSYDRSPSHPFMVQMGLSRFSARRPISFKYLASPRLLPDLISSMQMDGWPSSVRWPGRNQGLVFPTSTSALRRQPFHDVIGLGPWDPALIARLLCRPLAQGYRGNVCLGLIFVQTKMGHLVNDFGHVTPVVTIDL